MMLCREYLGQVLLREVAAVLAYIDSTRKEEQYLRNMLDSVTKNTSLSKMVITRIFSMHHMDTIRHCKFLLMSSVGKLFNVDTKSEKGI
jgi:hypothetical protein